MNKVIFVIIVGLLIMSVTVFLGSMRPVFAEKLTFDPPINLSNNNGGVLPQITAAERNVYVLWSAGFAGSVLRASNDNGNSFGDPIPLRIGQDMAASDDHVYVVGAIDSVGNIFITVSNDNGHTFNTINDLSNNAGTSALPRIAAWGNNVYVVWHDDGSGNFDILFRASNDNAASFGDAINLSDSAGTSSDPLIHAYGSSVYVVWEEDIDHDYFADEIYFRASNDGGKSFGDIINLSNDSTRSYDPRIVASGNNVYVVWQDDHKEKDDLWARDVFFRASNDGGTTFGDVINLTADTRSSDDVNIAASGNNVYVTWNDNFAVFFRASSDSGASFRDPVMLSDKVGRLDFQWQPKIVVSENNVYVLWTDERDMFFRASDDSGLTFGDIIVLSSEDTKSSGGKGAIDLAASGGYVYAVWNDFATEQWEILFRKGFNNNPIIITELELNSSGYDSLDLEAFDCQGLKLNSKQWIEIHNASDRTIDLKDIGIELNQGQTMQNALFQTQPLQPREYRFIELSTGLTFSTNKSFAVVRFGDYPLRIDSTPVLNDSMPTYKTWQRLDGEWVFRDATPCSALPAKNIKIEIDGREFVVLVNGTGEADLIELNKETTSLALLLRSAKSTSINVTVPRELLGGPYGVGMKYKQQEWEPRELEVNQNYTHATFFINLPSGETTIRILGTTVIPEFPVAFIVLGASLAGLLIASRYRSLKFHRS